MAANDRMGMGIVLAFVAYFVGAAVYGFNPALALLGLVFKALVYGALLVIPCWVIALLARRR
jgi:hypothetical protein